MKAESPYVDNPRRLTQPSAFILQPLVFPPPHPFANRVSRRALARRMAAKRKVRAGMEQSAAVRSFAVPSPSRFSVADPSGLGIRNAKHRIDRVLLGPYIDPRVLLRLRDDQACLADSLGRLSGGSAASLCFQRTHN